MVWQRLIGHINGHRARVRSKSGKEYPVETETDTLNDSIYSQLINDAHDDVTFWAWVEFEDDGPVLRDFKRGDMPDRPPWAY